MQKRTTIGKEINVSSPSGATPIFIAMNLDDFDDFESFVFAQQVQVLKRTQKRLAFCSTRHHISTRYGHITPRMQMLTLRHMASGLKDLVFPIFDILKILSRIIWLNFDKSLKGRAMKPTMYLMYESYLYIKNRACPGEELRMMT